MEGGSLLINMLGWGGLFTEYPGYDRNSHGGCQSRETRRWLTGKPSGGAKLPATLESTEWLRLAEWHRSACFSATGKCQLPGEKRKNLQQKGDSSLTVTQWKIQGVVTSPAPGLGKDEGGVVKGRRQAHKKNKPLVSLFYESSSFDHIVWIFYQSVLLWCINCKVPN